MKILRMHRRNHDLRRIPSCHSLVLITNFMCQNLKHPQPSHPLHKALQPLLIPNHLIPASPVHIPDAPLHSRHKQIRRTGRLKHGQIPSNSVLIHKISLHMQDRRLRKARQRLMNTLDHNIRPIFQRRLRKTMTPIRKLQMRPVCFIHDQRNPILMSYIRNCLYIRHHALVSWGCDQDSLDLCAFFPPVFRIFYAFMVPSILGIFLIFRASCVFRTLQIS